MKIEQKYVRNMQGEGLEDFFSLPETGGPILWIAGVLILLIAVLWELQFTVAFGSAAKAV